MNLKTRNGSIVQSYITPDSGSTHFQNLFQQDCALTETVVAVRVVRDELLWKDQNSRAGLVLGQVGLVLQRLQHGIPSRRETFYSLLRAAGLVEEKPACEMVEV